MSGLQRVACAYGHRRFQSADEVAQGYVECLGPVLARRFARMFLEKMTRDDERLPFWRAVVSAIPRVVL